MMIPRVLLFFPITVLALACTQAHAYEEEPALPLTIISHNERGNIEKIVVRLIGNEVEIKTDITNKTKSEISIGFAAYTPFFKAPEIAEDNHDKEFRSLKVTINGVAAKINTARRAFLLGNDITEDVRRAGMPVLPTVETDTYSRKWRGLPIDAWDGFVAHSWIPRFAPNSTSTQVIRYRALPQFGRDEMDSPKFERAIFRHCGDVREVQKSLATQVPGIEYLMFDRYDIPITFLKGQEARIDVIQPAKAGDAKRALQALACGTSNRKGEGANFTATIESPEDNLSILVISSFPGSVTEKEAK